MKHSSKSFLQFYETALSAYLNQKSPPNTRVPEQIGDEFSKSKLSVLDFAKFHEDILVSKILPKCPIKQHASLIRKAGNFFAEIFSVPSSDNDSACNAARLTKVIESLSGHTVELSAANRQLGQEILQREKVEAALRDSEQDLLQSLSRSEALKEQLRQLSRKVLTAQEDERKKISRELHDVIAQSLLGINVHLATLKIKAGVNAEGLVRNINRTQKLVKKSADVVHAFARKLRPAVLDDLGLIPALHSFMKSFMARTGVRAQLIVFSEVENITAMKRMVLYRVAQEALNNVDRHANASHVRITIQQETKSVFMEISDNGCSFDVENVLTARGSRRLGLLGMRERVEMVGGSFEIHSEVGEGTKILLRIPVSRATIKKWRTSSAESESLSS